MSTIDPSKRHFRLLTGPNHAFLLTTKPFSRSTRRPHAFRLVIQEPARDSFSEAFDEEARFLAECLGFFGPRDADSSAFRLFRELLSLPAGEHVSGSRLSRSLGLSRGATLHQLNNMVRAGFAAKRGQVYGLRANSALSTVEELEREVEQVFARMKRAARAIDAANARESDDADA